MNDNLRQSKDQSGVIRLLLVDDHRLFCEGLAALLASIDDLQVVGMATDADAAMRLAEELRPDIVLMNVVLPGRSAFDAARSIRDKNSTTKIVFVADSAFDVQFREALRIGAKGYFLKKSEFTELEKGIRIVAAGETFFSAEIYNHFPELIDEAIVEQPGEADPVATLTPRELEVLLYLVRGMSIKEIARLMRRSKSTVDNHKSRIMHKLGMHRTVDLVRFAMRQGLVEN